MKPFLKLPAIAAISISLILAPGCTTTEQTPEQRADQIAALVGSATFTATVLILDDNPELRPAFETVANQLEQLSITPTFGVDELEKILASLPVDELQTRDAKLIIGNVVTLLEGFGLSELQAENLVYLRPVASQLSRAINRALGL